MLMDMKRPRKARKFRVACGEKVSAETQAARTRRQRISRDKSFWWGAAHFLFSEKLNGETLYEASCHRKCCHKSVLGRERTTCRQSSTITDDNPEVDAIRRLKFWIGNAHNYTSKLHHQKFKPLIEDVPSDEELELMKPPSDYASDASEPDARPPPRRSRARGRGRGRGRTARVSEAEAEDHRGDNRGRGRGRGRGRRRKARGAEAEAEEDDSSDHLFVDGLKTPSCSSSST